MTSDVYFYQKDTSEFQVPYLPFSLNLFFVIIIRSENGGKKKQKSLGVKRQKSKASQDTRYKWVKVDLKEQTWFIQVILITYYLITKAF